jgi:hypothetical protein
MAEAAVTTLIFSFATTAQGCGAWKLILIFFLNMSKRLGT